MKKQLITVLGCLALSLGALPALAEEADDIVCLDCHVPEEDWPGMFTNEILAEAVNVEIPRHEGNEQLGEEKLRQMIEQMMAE